MRSRPSTSITGVIMMIEFLRMDVDERRLLDREPIGQLHQHLRRARSPASGSSRPPSRWAWPAAISRSPLRRRTRPRGSASLAMISRSSLEGRHVLFIGDQNGDDHLAPLSLLPIENTFTRGLFDSSSRM